jgi:hypothetical protein
MTAIRMSRFSLVPSALAGSGWIAYLGATALIVAIAAGLSTPVNGLAIAFGTVGYLYAGCIAIVAGAAAAVATSRTWLRRDLRGGRWGLVGLLASLVLAAAVWVPIALLAGLVVLAVGALALIPVAPMGRPLPEGPALVRRGKGWAAALPMSAERSELWRERGREEHASVPAFARLAIELVSVGAPAHLVDGALAAAREEVDHARNAFALAGGFEPIALPCADVSLTDLALSSVRDGRLGEGFAAAIALEESKRCDGVEASVLRAIAAEERAHADLSARIVRWAVWEGGHPVRKAVEAQLRRMPPVGTARSELLSAIEIAGLYLQVRGEVRQVLAPADQ